MKIPAVEVSAHGPNPGYAWPPGGCGAPPGAWSGGYGEVVLIVKVSVLP